MSGHTPGPWIVDTLDGSPLIYCPAQRADVAYVALYTTHPIKDHPVVINHHEANAHLIAAAPDLLQCAYDFQEALQELALECNCGEADCRTTRLRAAIAKATGESA